jgi:PhnB protein
MSNLAANPYINFRGHAREAMEFYQKALGGTLELSTFTEQGAPKEAGPDDAIMHAVLTVDSLRIMGSDGMPAYPPTVGDNIAVALSGSDHELLSKAFDLLSEGGIVKQALKTESWGDSFGYFVDKFDINWMVNISKSENQ